ncbi:YibE/F family protein, partial [Bittarella massiliensis (ex Durand et al. 2017)]
LTTLVTLYHIGGPTRKSLCAILGTVAGVGAAGGIAALFGALGRISGYNVSDIETMIVIGQHSRLQIGGVLFSGILIASLGAVMDVAMSISSTASELIAQTPSLTRR